jgi:hypothetical protein
MATVLITGVKSGILGTTKQAAAHRSVLMTSKRVLYGKRFTFIVTKHG